MGVAQLQVFEVQKKKGLEEEFWPAQEEECVGNTFVRDCIR